jgi:hypothetical protein
MSYSNNEHRHKFFRVARLQCVFTSRRAKLQGASPINFTTLGARAIWPESRREQSGRKILHLLAAARIEVQFEPFDISKEQRIFECIAESLAQSCHRVRPAGPGVRRRGVRAKREGCSAPQDRHDDLACLTRSPQSRYRGRLSYRPLEDCWRAEDRSHAQQVASSRPSRRASSVLAHFRRQYRTGLIHCRMM